MATAERRTEVEHVQRIVLDLKTTETIHLTLTPAEAQTLADVIYRIRGDRINSRHNHTQSVTEALGSVGIHFDPASDIYGAIAFLRK